MSALAQLKLHTADMVQSQILLNS